MAYHLNASSYNILSGPLVVPSPTETSYKWRTLGTPPSVINTVTGNTIGIRDFLTVG